ncbi:S41 family peptidase [Anaerosalibacter sp. Marseille-P3206]|uniref:S41 family peptidase n=1 Tax=Anaerosalibacter sp. Marseille-P3206 TaxID=1871005 RepID=UPI0009863D75|nr:S41 family peptidase [Anaerosalibacter sp. Marseille-P3206]
MKKRNVYKIVLVFALIISTVFSVPAVSVAETGVQDEYSLGYFHQIMKLIEENYVYDVNQDELLEGALQGLFYNLDEHSEYYTKDELDTLMKDIDGNFVGVGVVISQEPNGDIEVVTPLEGSPAEKVGMKSGDKIISIDGKSIKGLTTDEVVQLISGEIGTKVKIGVQRSRNKTPIYLTITRDEIKINPISHKILKGDIGYINISQFNDNTYENLLPVLKKFDKAGISDIIIDLRDNPGGLLDEVVKVSRKFIPKGPIVHIKHRGKIEETYYSYLPKTKYKLAVLVNENSASASEIFAGAVQDTKVGTIIGVTSYGKGTVQQIRPLPNGDGMKLTIAEYLTPKKRSINGKGVVPDIEVKENPLDLTKDIQLEKAIEIVTQL